MLKISLLSLSSLIFFCILTSCTTDLKQTDFDNYDPFYLAEGEFVRNGNPYTGQGYVRNMISRLPENLRLAPYSFEGISKTNSKSFTRKPEIVRFIYIYPRLINDSYSEALRILVVMKPSAWQ